jgi:hypothetical protein
MQRGQVGASGRQRRLRNGDENRKFYRGHISDLLKHVVETNIIPPTAFIASSRPAGWQAISGAECR